mmetsp:Transcript_11727/g.27338  ORF Transcript_11727/g.27338 Transcript_11727/m.27338 type:complete len:203 (+) Transcript_11727:93-701(+)
MAHGEEVEERVDGEVNTAIRLHEREVDEGGVVVVGNALFRNGSEAEEESELCARVNQHTPSTRVHPGCGAEGLYGPQLGEAGELSELKHLLLSQGIDRDGENKLVDGAAGRADDRLSRERRVDQQARRVSHKSVLQPSVLDTRLARWGVATLCFVVEHEFEAVNACGGGADAERDGDGVALWEDVDGEVHGVDAVQVMPQQP